MRKTPLGGLFFFTRSLMVDPDPGLCVGRLEMCKDQLKGVHQAFTGSLHRRRSTRGSSGASWEDPGRNFQDAMGWIAQQKVFHTPDLTLQTTPTLIGCQRSEIPPN